MPSGSAYSGCAPERPVSTMAVPGREDLSSSWPGNGSGQTWSVGMIHSSPMAVWRGGGAMYGVAGGGDYLCDAVGDVFGGEDLGLLVEGVDHLVADLGLVV